MVPVRQCSLALLVFLLFGLPVHLLIVEPYGAGVLAGARALTSLVGDSQEIVGTASGTRVVARGRVLEDFFADPAQRTSDYNVLALWAWIAVAPLLPWRRRLRLAAGALVSIAVVDALALGCLALAWYNRTLVERISDAPLAWTRHVAVLEGSATLLAVAALLLIPLFLGLHAYPGLDLERAGNLASVRPSGN